MSTSVSQSSVAVAKALPVLDGSRSAMQLSSCSTVAVSGQVISMVGAVRSNVLIVCVQDSVVLLPLQSTAVTTKVRVKL